MRKIFLRLVTLTLSALAGITDPRIDSLSLFELTVLYVALDHALLLVLVLKQLLQLIVVSLILLYLIVVVLR